MLSIQRWESYAKPTNVTLKINIGLSLHRLFLREFFFSVFIFWVLSKMMIIHVEIHLMCLSINVCKVVLRVLTLISRLGLCQAQTIFIPAKINSLFLLTKEHFLVTTQLSKQPKYCIFSLTFNCISTAS